MKVFVLGTGGWGIALAMLLHQNGHEVTSWTYLQEECDLLHREPNISVSSFNVTFRG